MPGLSVQPQAFRFTGRSEATRSLLSTRRCPTKMSSPKDVMALRPLLLLIHGVGPFDEPLVRENVTRLLASSPDTSNHYDVAAVDWRSHVPAGVRRAGLHTRTVAQMSLWFAGHRVPAPSLRRATGFPITALLLIAP